MFGAAGVRERPLEVHLHPAGVAEQRLHGVRRLPDALGRCPVAQADRPGRCLSQRGKGAFADLLHAAGFIKLYDLDEGVGVE